MKKLQIKTQNSKQLIKKKCYTNTKSRECKQTKNKQNKTKNER